MQKLTRAQISRTEIEKLYVVMRHLFNRGYYKPFGISGNTIMQSLLTISPEIYGSINDSSKVELEGLAYVIDRLPKGIEECKYVKLISEEGYSSSGFEKIIPASRRRNCYRVDQDQMIIEVTRGRSEIYDILTHLTFLNIEAEKIKNHALTNKKATIREWDKLEAIVLGKEEIKKKDMELALTYLSTILGRTFEETKKTYNRFKEKTEKNNGLFQIIYWLGKNAIDEELNGIERVISFSPILRERIGHHIYGERWATKIKAELSKKKILNRPIHIISANLHSVLNCIYAEAALPKSFREGKSLAEIASSLSLQENKNYMQKIEAYARNNGMHFIKEESGTNISVQIFDFEKIDPNKISGEIKYSSEYIKSEKPVLIVMDYAFGEQAFETMDELLKSYKPHNGKEVCLNIKSISIMGKAGILCGEKGDIMIPNAHIFEGTTDNYPFENDFTEKDFQDENINVYEGPMVTVLGTSLQNKDILSYFSKSSWKAVGLEMEGAHYQKAIQAASKIRKSIDENVTLRYAYYASDNPLITGSTLASGSLGLVGVKPTYLITERILEGILNPKDENIIDNNEIQKTSKIVNL